MFEAWFSDGSPPRAEKRKKEEREVAKPKPKEPFRLSFSMKESEIRKYDGKTVKCPKCGAWGKLTYRITYSGEYTYRYWYVRHWDVVCYIGKTYPPKPPPKHRKLDEFF
jgi:hypothetical protein